MLSLPQTNKKFLKNSNPVAIEWAAKYENEWTLHFSVVSGLDLGNVVLEKTLEGSFDSKEIKQVNLKGNQP